MTNLTQYDGDPSEHIAIVGMVGRFPGAQNLEAFWRNLRDGVESIKFFTAAELAGSNLDPALRNNPKYVGADGVIEDMDLFDAEFFGISPREAELMDPQHRLFLECAWELMEQAGYDSESYAGRVAVYGSANLSTYLIRNIMSNPDLRERATSFQTLITNDKDYVATRVSYKLNLRGPSLSVATLCSSSFVAIHLAGQALLNLQCDLALAGAAALQVSRNESFFYQEGGIGDPDGHCRAFDAKASGTVSGSGIGIVALKRLDEALKDGDTIHAVIRATALNNDGAIKYSYTAPSLEGQAEVIAEALSLAEVDPETIAYVETHGTGTRLGDPIEVTALTQAFRSGGAQKKQYCAIGSVKTNIGHLVNAGGVASLIKTVLALQHHQIPPSLNFDEPNPEIDFADSPFYVATRLADWPANGSPRRAGVSSFGIGGTNVHLIVEEAPEVEPSGAARPWQLLVLSAKTDTALETQTFNLVEYLKAHPEVKLADVAFTLQVGRRGLEQRRAVLCRDAPDAIEALTAQSSARVLTQFQGTRNRPVAFLFPGVSETPVNVGRELYRSEPAFRDAIDACCTLFQPQLGLDLHAVLYPDLSDGGRTHSPQGQVMGDERSSSFVPGLSSASGDLLHPTRYTQPALFAVEYALAQLWLEWGIEPQAMLGIGVGEVVAACLAGVFSLEVAVGLAAGKGQVTSADLSAPRIPGVSGTSGNWISESEATRPDYWLKRLEQARPFADCVEPLLSEPEQVLLEVGPGQFCRAQIMSHPDKVERQVVLSSLDQARDASDIESMLATLGQLWLAGARVDWYGLHAHARRQRLPLPTYPFERKRYWIEPYQPGAQPATQGAQAGTLDRKPEIADWFYAPGWKSAPLPQPRSFGESEGSWLLFADACGVGAALAEQLRQAGQPVISVEAGTEFSRRAADVYTLDMRRRADYTALFKELAASDRLPRRIVYLWSIAADERDRADGFKPALDNGFNSLLCVAQALAEQPSADAVQLWVVSNHTQKVESADVVSPERATILGLCKAIPQENAQASCHHVDVALPGRGTLAARDLSRQLLNEIRADAPEPIVAYRGRQRWLQVFEPVRLAGVGEPIRSLREQGVYLIASGLSDISLALAQHLARTVRARLVVIENEAFPKREQWSHSNGHAEGVHLKIESLRALEAAGADVLVVNADLTNVAQMRSAIEQATARFGAVNGVLHAVGDFGVATFTPIQDMSETDGIRRFESRMRGLCVLQEVLAGQDLDFCLLVSSLSSILGGVGQAAYTAANIFMDAFAVSHGAPWLSINWDAWQFEAEQQRIAALTPRLAQFAISPPEGGQAFERILSSYTGDQLVVSTGDLAARMRHWLGGEPWQAEFEGRRERHARPQLSTPYAAPTTDLEKTLAEVWQATLGIDQIGIDDNFFDLGGDSLIAVKTITRLEKALQRKVPAANLYQTPSIRALAALLSQDEAASTQQRAAQLGERREALSRRNVQLHQRRRG
ncbi:MAG TPA: beta-ketoacyl synthase N-terminal-like domain-containing protein [Anaerolineae bacterium]|nr:beta-ketoacyl synthase N-terminal-like domain-containing protein [Anaerolineae bacterium]